MYRFKKFISILTYSLLLTACGALTPSKKASLQLNFLDEYIIPADAKFGNTKIGGLSGIEGKDNEYFMVCDHPSAPRIYKTILKTNQKKIDTLIFTEVILLNKKDSLLQKTYLDLEGLIISPKKEFTVITEGAIKKGKDPSIIQFNKKGEVIKMYEIPSAFKANSRSQPRNNHVFESITTNYNQQGFWVANEIPLKADGPKPKLYRTQSPVRFTYYDFENPQPKKQFTYPLGRIRRFPFLPFSLNGLTDILSLDKNRFLTLERAFSAGRGKKSYRVLIYEYVVHQTTNTLNKGLLRNNTNQNVEKNLVLDLEHIRKLLPQKTIDNLEGFCYGPTLKNGNKTLLLIADNNFNSFMTQYNQLLWLEITNN